MFSLNKVLVIILHISANFGAVNCFFNEIKKTDEEHAQSLIEWLEEKEDGYFNPKLEMRRVDPKDSKSFFGMFVKDDIEEGETLLYIPSSMILDSTEEDPDLDAMTCATVRNLIEQIKLKDESRYAPYINYILDTQPPGAIPSAWTENGKKLLTRVLGGKNGEFPVALPLADDPFPWIDHWHKYCKGSDDPIEEYAALIVIQRSWDDILIPVFDMMSHRNGWYLNSESNNVHEGEDIEVTAKRYIEAGEQIYTSYNMCEDCGGRALTYGTPEILREYGFVEQMPQNWIFHDLELGFRIDEGYDDEGIPTGFYTVTDWIFGEPDEYDLEKVNEMLEQTSKTKETILSQRVEDVPDFEWNTINNYINALELALQVAISASGSGEDIPVLTEEDYKEEDSGDEDEEGDYYDEEDSDDDEEDSEEHEEHTEL